MEWEGGGKGEAGRRGGGELWLRQDGVQGIDGETREGKKGEGGRVVEGEGRSGKRGGEGRKGQREG